MALTVEQKNRKLLFESKSNIFLTGRAGTGKTTLIKEYIQKNPNTIICAPTGIAAVNAGGETMHKVFHIPVPAYGAKISSVTSSKITALIKADTVIIDEISMARNDAFSFAIRVLKKAEKEKGSKIRVIVCGDFSQLPPVVNKADKNMLKKFGYDESGYAFTTKEWNALNFKTIVLENVKRQSDVDFINMLNKVREGNPESIPYFNKYYTPATNLYESQTICICGTNVEADRINKIYLDSLKGSITAYVSEKTGKTTGCAIEDVILLKEGAQIIFTTNDVVDNKYQNGTIGKVVKCGSDFVVVDVNGDVFSIKAHKFSIYSYSVANGELQKKEIGSISQIPIKLAKAITIHKSQGQTFDCVILSPQIFASGQLYVALSRVKTPEGLSLTEPITEAYLKGDNIVEEFYKNGYKYESKSTTRTSKTKKTTVKPKPKAKSSASSTKKNSPKTKRKSTTNKRGKQLDKRSTKKGL